MLFLFLFAGNRGDGDKCWGCGKVVGWWGVGSAPARIQITHSPTVKVRRYPGVEVLHRPVPGPHDAVGRRVQHRRVFNVEDELGVGDGRGVVDGNQRAVQAGQAGVAARDVAGALHVVDDVELRVEVNMGEPGLGGLPSE